MSILDKYLALVFAVIPLTWAGSFIAGKLVATEVDPVLSVFLRFLLTAVCIFPFLILWRRRTHPNLLERSYLIHLAIGVLFAGIIYHIFFFWALQHASPTNTALIIALNPFFTAIGEILLFKRARSGRFYIGFLTALSGALWVNMSRGEGLTAPGVGELFCLIASLSWSVYTLAAKRTKRPEWDSLWINAYVYLFTAVFLLPFILNAFTDGTLTGLSRAGWMGFWYMAIFPTGIGYTLYYIGVQKRGPAWAATYIYLVPSITANLDHLFFGASFTVPMVIGTTLVVFGLLTGNLTVQQLGMTKRWILGLVNHGKK